METAGDVAGRTVGGGCWLSTVVGGVEGRNGEMEGKLGGKQIWGTNKPLRIVNAGFQFFIFYFF
jgi:hypothetical protein